MKLQVEKRKITGKKVKRLRLKQILPGVLVEPKKDSINIEVPQGNFLKTYKKAGLTEIFDLSLEDKTYPVIIEEIAHHPVTGVVTHVNFRIVNLKQKLKVNVPIVYINEELHPLIKSNNALLLTQIDEVEVEALPNNLPKKFVLDVLKLVEIGDSFTIKDLKQLVDPTKVEIIEKDDSITISTLDYAKQQKETVEEKTSSVEDVKITSEKTKEDSNNEETTSKDKN